MGMKPMAAGKFTNITSDTIQIPEIGPCPSLAETYSYNGPEEWLGEAGLLVQVYYPSESSVLCSMVVIKDRNSDSTDPFVRVEVTVDYRALPCLSGIVQCIVEQVSQTFFVFFTGPMCIRYTFWVQQYEHVNSKADFEGISSGAKRPFILNKQIARFDKLVKERNDRMKAKWAKEEAEGNPPPHRLLELAEREDDMPALAPIPKRMNGLVPIPMAPEVQNTYNQWKATRVLDFINAGPVKIPKAKPLKKPITADAEEAALPMFFLPSLTDIGGDLCLEAMFGNFTVEVECKHETIEHSKLKLLVLSGVAVAK